MVTFNLFSFCSRAFSQKLSSSKVNCFDMETSESNHERLNVVITIKSEHQTPPYTLYDDNMNMAHGTEDDVCKIDEMFYFRNEKRNANAIYIYSYNDTIYSLKLCILERCWLCVFCLIFSTDFD